MDLTKPLERDVPESKKLDIYRETPLRYLGYANEVGEAFRAMIGGRWVAVSYGVATAYVMADTADKAYGTYTSSRTDADRIKKTLYAATDSLLWQMLASVAVPGFTINRVCAASDYALRRSGRIAPGRRMWIVTAIGLLTIPFIIKPIDNMTDQLLDATLRNFKPK